MSERGTFGRYAELPLNEMNDEQRAAYADLMAERGQIPGPYKIILQNPKLIHALMPLGIYFQKAGASLTRAEVEIVTNLTNARWLADYSNFEHEVMAEAAGLPADKVEALIAGLPTSFEDHRQQAVYQVASTLVAPRVLPRGLYDRAVDLIGHAGLTDLTVLIGYYTSISMTLMAYDVPGNAVGLER